MQCMCVQVSIYDSNARERNKQKNGRSSKGLVNELAIRFLGIYLAQISILNVMNDARFLYKTNKQNMKIRRAHDHIARQLAGGYNEMIGGYTDYTAISKDDCGSVVRAKQADYIITK